MTILLVEVFAQMIDVCADSDALLSDTDGSLGAVGSKVVDVAAGLSC